MVGEDDINTYINDPTIFEDLFESMGFTTINHEVKNRLDTKFLLYKLSDGTDNNLYWYVSPISETDYIASCGEIIEYDGMNMDEVLTYISNMNNSVKTYNSFAANSNQKKITDLKHGNFNAKFDDFK